MADLIDREALSTALCELARRNPVMTVGIHMARKMVTGAPTIDAAPVVHCLDCMHSEIHRIRDGLFGETDVRKCELRAFLSVVVDDDDFCSKGERMDADAPERAGKERE